MATKRYEVLFTDALHNLLNYLGLGDSLDEMLWNWSGKNKHSYYDNLIKQIDNEMNKLRKENSQRLNRANSLLNDVYQVAPSTAFKNKLNQIKREAKKEIDLANDIDNKITATENQAKIQADRLNNQTFLATADLLPKVEKEVKGTISLLKQNIGENKNESTEKRF